MTTRALPVYVSDYSGGSELKVLLALPEDVIIAMRRLIAFTVLTFSGSLFGCKEEEAPPPQYPQQPYGQQPYPPQDPYAQPQPQPQPYPTAQPAPAPTPAPTVAAPVPTATAPALSPPGPLALQCTSDANCVTFRCNTQYGKCASPCQTDNDCIPGNKCQFPGPTGICIPAP